RIRSRLPWRHSPPPHGAKPPAAIPHAVGARGADTWRGDLFGADGGTSGGDVDTALHLAGGRARSVLRVQPPPRALVALQPSHAGCRDVDRRGLKSSRFRKVQSTGSASRRGPNSNSNDAEDTAYTELPQVSRQPALRRTCLGEFVVNERKAAVAQRSPH